jgi:3-hydroxyacyl-[acyl-carrier-protein] dehydratase
MQNWGNYADIGVAKTERGYVYSLFRRFSVPTTRGASTMRFHLIDRVVSWESGKVLRAEKRLTLGEEYLADHFPGFPVMPGVMMLQAVIEASAWLWRASTGFERCVVAMREAKNVKYGTFMQPGFTMELVTEIVKMEGDTATFKGKGNIQGGGQTVNGQVTLTAYNAPDADENEALRKKLKHHWMWLNGQAK